MHILSIVGSVDIHRSSVSPSPLRWYAREWDVEGHALIRGAGRAWRPISRARLEEALVASVQLGITNLSSGLWRWILLLGYSRNLRITTRCARSYSISAPGGFSVVLLYLCLFGRGWEESRNASADHGLYRCDFALGGGGDLVSKKHLKKLWASPAHCWSRGCGRSCSPTRCQIPDPG